MLKTLFRYSFLLVLLLFLVGCQKMTYEFDPLKNVYSGSLMDAKPVGHLDVTKTAGYLFWGLVPINTPKVEDVIKEYTRPDQFVADIRIEEENAFPDGCLAGITLGIYRPRTIRYTGIIYNKEASANEK